MILDEAVVATALDPALIEHSAHYAAERIYLELIRADGLPTEPLIAVARHALTLKVDFLVAVSGHSDAASRGHFWRFLVAAFVRRVAELEVWGMPTGEMQ